MLPCCRGRCRFLSISAQSLPVVVHRPASDQRCAGVHDIHQSSVQEYATDGARGRPEPVSCFKSLIPSGYEPNFGFPSTSGDSCKPDAHADDAASSEDEEGAWTLVEHRGRGAIENRLWKAWLRGDTKAAEGLLSAADYQKRMGAGLWAWPVDRRREEAQRCARPAVGQPFRSRVLDIGD